MMNLTKEEKNYLEDLATEIAANAFNEAVIERYQSKEYKDIMATVGDTNKLKQKMELAIFCKITELAARWLENDAPSNFQTDSIDPDYKIFWDNFWND